MRRWARALTALLALVAIGAAVKLTLFRAAPVPVTVFIVSVGRVEETVTNSKSGSVKARYRARLSPAIGGRVAELPVRKGDRVGAGAVLLRLDEAEQRARVALAERAVATAAASEKQACLDAELAQREFQRAESLFREGITTDAQLDQAHSRRDVSQAGCEAGRSQASQARAQLQVARVDLDKTVLRAPFGGIVADLTTERGEWITPSPPGVPIPPVIDLIDPDSIYVSAPLDEVDVERVEVGQPARITLDAMPGRSLTGRITRISPVVEDVQGESRTFEVEAAFDDSALAKRLPPGASADIEVILQARDGVLRVPSYALLEGKRVLVLERDRLVGRSVAVGLKNWEFAEIKEGLREADRVVVSLDRAEVKEGARARQESVAEK